MASPNVFERVSRGGRWVVTGRVLGIALTVAINALLARVLGPAGFGGFVMTMTLMGLLSLIGMVGLNEALVRFISESLARRLPRTAARIVLRAIAICLAAFLLVGPVAFVVICFTPLGLETVGDVPHIALLVVLGAAALGLQQLAAEALRGFHHLKLASLFAGGQTGGLLCTGILLSLLIVASAQFQLTLSVTLTLVLMALVATLPFTYIALFRTARSARSIAKETREVDGPTLRVLIPVGGTIMIFLLIWPRGIADAIARLLRRTTGGRASR